MCPHGLNEMEKKNVVTWLSKAKTNIRIPFGPRKLFSQC